MSNLPDVPLVPLRMTFEVGDNYSADVKMMVPETTEPVYFAGGFSGWADGIRDASSFLLDILPDNLPDNMKIQKQAGLVAKPANFPE